MKPVPAACGVFPPRSLETPRLLLRRPSLDDAPALFAAWASDDGAMRFLSWPVHTDPLATRRLLEGILVGWERHLGYRAWVLAPHGGSPALGLVGYDHDVHGVELSYVLAPAHQGQGLMHEALTAVRDAALGCGRVFRLWAACHPQNLASARVLERLGMQREGTLRRYGWFPNLDRRAPLDCVLYALAREEDP